jgi:biopolymer transport protein ExbD
MKQQSSPSIPIAPMIDCVFLLLVYFMVSTTMDREEAPMPVAVPGSSSGTSIELPEEQVIWIQADGQIIVNDYAYDDARSRELPNLTNALIRFREICESDGVQPTVVLIPEADVVHQRIIDVMDALTRAGLENIQFSTAP